MQRMLPMAEIVMRIGWRRFGTEDRALVDLPRCISSIASFGQHRLGIDDSAAGQRSLAVGLQLHPAFSSEYAHDISAGTHRISRGAKLGDASDKLPVSLPRRILVGDGVMGRIMGRIAHQGARPHRAGLEFFTGHCHCNRARTGGGGDREREKLYKAEISVGVCGQALPISVDMGPGKDLLHPGRGSYRFHPADNQIGIGASGEKSATVQLAVKWSAIERQSGQKTAKKTG